MQKITKKRMSGFKKFLYLAVQRTSNSSKKFKIKIKNTKKIAVDDQIKTFAMTSQSLFIFL